MKRLIQLTLATIFMVTAFSFAPLATTSVGAVNVFEKGCPGGNAPSGTSAGGAAICGATNKDDVPSIIETVINTILVVLGMIAVIMIVIGGIRYTTSNGDAGSTKAAKDTILYAVVGLVVAILAYAIVNFVLARFL